MDIVARAVATHVKSHRGKGGPVARRGASGVELHFRVGGGNRAASIMIRNGLYLATTRFLDGVDAHNRHIMVLRDGTIRGGGPFFYTVGSFTYSDGKWKGEMTSQEHSPIVGSHPWARKVVSIGFSGTYSDDGAELEAIALAGKQSFRFKSIYRLLFAD